MPSHGPPGDPHGTSPGYRRRKQELEEAEEVAREARARRSLLPRGIARRIPDLLVTGDTPENRRLLAARRALRRQENIIRLRRRKRPGER